jgi:hypothetical protein
MGLPARSRPPRLGDMVRWGNTLLCLAEIERPFLEKRFAAPLLEPDLPRDFTRRAEGAFRFWPPFFRENRLSRFTGRSPLVFCAWTAAGSIRKRQRISSPALTKAGCNKRMVFGAYELKKWFSETRKDN